MAARSAVTRRERRSGAVRSVSAPRLGGAAAPAKPSALRDTAGKVFPQLAGWWPVLDRAGVAEPDAIRIAATAERHGTGVGQEAVALGCVTAANLTAAIAEELGLEWQPAVDPGALVLSDEQAAALLGVERPTMLVKCSDGRDTSMLLATVELDRLRQQLALYPAIRPRLRLVPGDALRTALTARVSASLGLGAVFDLFSSRPACSARSAVNAWQGCVLGALAVGLPVAIWTWPMPTFGALHVVFTFFFLSCVALRFAAVVAGRAAEPPAEPPSCPADLPLYSVLVALYDEAEMAGQVVAAMRRLDWPASKLEVKFVCEADDEATVAALSATRLPAHMEIVLVPDLGPRTKPKALNYALRTCRGAFVVLYDAEDRPHPGQLREAWRRFGAGDDALACLQAPLEIVNGERGWIAGGFAFEYVALFRGLLPWLARRRLLLPLGGTSNHFRRAVLEEVGAWDPFNVTEDADLGTRLARHGYRTEMLTLPTLETAPETARVWVPQRTRWFKGWLQTWLVHMRDPALLYRELGGRSFLVVQVLFGGMVVSAAVHPVFLATMGWVCVDLALGRPIDTFQSALLVVDTVNIVAGYVSFWLLGRQATPPGARRPIWRVVAATPAYWLMMSYAAWRAALQLYRFPHLWEKTPHGAAAQAEGRLRPAGRTLAAPAE